MIGHGSGLSNRTVLAFAYVWPGRRFHFAARCVASPLLDPSLHFGEVPNRRAWCEVEATREFVALLHLVGHGNTKYAPEGQPLPVWLHAASERLDGLDFLLAEMKRRKSDFALDDVSQLISGNCITLVVGGVACMNHLNIPEDTFCALSRASPSVGQFLNQKLQRVTGEEAALAREWQERWRTSGPTMDVGGFGDHRTQIFPTAAAYIQYSTAQWSTGVLTASGLRALRNRCPSLAFGAITNAHPSTPSAATQAALLPANVAAVVPVNAVDNRAAIEANIAAIQDIGRRIHANDAGRWIPVFSGPNTGITQEAPNASGRLDSQTHMLIQMFCNEYLALLAGSNEAGQPLLAETERTDTMRRLSSGQESFGMTTSGGIASPQQVVASRASASRVMRTIAEIVARHMELDKENGMAQRRCGLDGRPPHAETFSECIIPSSSR
jgi:hypothetical protein